MQINAIAICREKPKREKSQALFSLASEEERACIQDKPALNIIVNEAVDQKL